MLGLCVDPTVDTSDDDYQEPALSDDVLGNICVGECGVSASEVLTFVDATRILQVSRSSGAVSANSNLSSDDDVEQSEFEFMKSDLVFALLLSVYQSAGE